MKVITPEEYRCTTMRPGWFCTRQRLHVGPCAMRARWWMAAWLWLTSPLRRDVDD